MKPINFIFMFIVLVAGLDVGAANADRVSTSRVANDGAIRTGSTGTLGGGRANGNVRSANVARYSASSASQGGTQTIGRVARSAARSVTDGVNSSILTPIVRTAQNIGRSGRNQSRAASVSRATSVFSDVSKIGGGYAACRDAYATCMDQFCANANDTYRRCFCSDKFSDFRDAEDRLDKAVTLLAQFEDNNLNAVDKTAAEVAAMYSASEGERAIKKDTSAAAKMLDQIGDLLSGKSSDTNKGVSYKNIGLIDVNFASGLDDVWSGNSESSIFSGGSGVDLSTLEGGALYNNVHKQCLQMVADSCDGSAVTNMARSSYSILITQDCNAYAKKVDSKTEQVKQTVRTAEKYLREARLEEYRSHNSDDMNKCITAVRSAIQSDAACGANYVKCLDNTGAFINTMGEPIYSASLFKLTDLINLSGSVGDDVLNKNPAFNTFLDGKRMFAATALDSCRDIANDVWNEFKRSAIIEIAQAQDEKLEEVRMSCVETVAECYDAQSGALKSFGADTANTTAALSVAAARGMCADKLTACAALFGGEDGCSVDVTTGKVTAVDGEICGLDALVNFVGAVDNTRINQACDAALKNKLHELCTPDSGDQGYPYKCRLTDSATIQAVLTEHADLACTSVNDTSNTENTNAIITGLMDELKIEMDIMLADMCESLDGIWATTTDGNINNTLSAFYSKVSGGDKEKTSSWGVCLEKSVRNLCNDLGTKWASYNAATDTCDLTDAWFELKCNSIGGYWENRECYIVSGGEQ
ncbi:MAG: hypothetical protein ACLRFJ_02780 [Alphaproteobacteria bacterium]